MVRNASIWSGRRTVSVSKQQASTLSGQRYIYSSEKVDLKALQLGYVAIILL